SRNGAIGRSSWSAGRSSPRAASARLPRSTRTAKAEAGVAGAASTAGERPLRVAAFTGGALQPAARLRVRQYIAPLAEAGIAIDESWPSLGAFPPARRSLGPGWLVSTLAQRLPRVAL